MRDWEVLERLDIWLRIGLVYLLLWGMAIAFGWSLVTIWEWVR